MLYYAKVRHKEGAYIVEFPDIPNVNTYGETLKDAQQNAVEALNGALESDFERGYTLPRAKATTGRGMYPIEVYPHVEIAFRLRELRDTLPQSAIAHKLGISYQAYQKLENPRKCNPSIKTLEKISAVLNRKLHVSFV